MIFPLSQEFETINTKHEETIVEELRFWLRSLDV